METPHILSRDEILNVPTAQAVLVEVPEWGGSVYVRGLTGRERDQFELSMIETRGKSRKANLANMRARLVALCAVDAEENGKHLFTMSDVDRLGDLGADALQRVYAVAQTKSGLSMADVDELTVELGEEQSADSGSS